MGTIGRLKIFVLHGWAHDLKKWKDFVGELEKLGPKTVLLKIPGLTDKINRPWDIEDYVKWFSEKTKNEERKFIIIAHSNGGRIASAFTIKYPQQVEKLILIDSAGIHHDEFLLKLKRTIFANLARTGKRFTNSKFARNFLYFLARTRDYNDAEENMKRTMVNLVSFDKNFRPSEISVPTIIIWGKKDGMTPFSDAKVLHREIPKNKLFIINEAHHSPQFTNTEDVIKIISENL